MAEIIRSQIIKNLERGKAEDIINNARQADGTLLIILRTVRQDVFDERTKTDPKKTPINDLVTMSYWKDYFDHVILPIDDVNYFINKKGLRNYIIYDSNVHNAKVNQWHRNAMAKRTFFPPPYRSPEKKREISAARFAPARDMTAWKAAQNAKLKMERAELVKRLKEDDARREREQVERVERERVERHLERERAAREEEAREQEWMKEQNNIQAERVKQRMAQRKGGGRKTRRARKARKTRRSRA